MTATGAAIPLAPQELKGGAKQTKIECFTCGAMYYTGRKQVSMGTHHCRCGSGPMLPSRLEDCSDLTPDLLPLHPLYALEEERHDRALARAERAGGVRHTFQCAACARILASPEAMCSCGFQNSRSGGRYIEGGAFIPEGKSAPERPTLASLTPATRAERAAQDRADRTREPMPF